MIVFSASEIQPKLKKLLPEAALAVLTVLLVLVLFGFWGNRSNVAMSTRSLLVWIGRQWLADGGDFSHGWIMPLISLAVIWMKRK